MKVTIEAPIKKATKRTKRELTLEVKRTIRCYYDEQRKAAALLIT